MEPYVITIARGFGSGGKQIASALASELGINCYENRILTLASEATDIDEERFLESNERLTKKPKYGARLRKLPVLGSPKPESTFVSDDNLFEYERQIIESLADTEACVIVGKCSDYVLKGRKRVISVYIEAPRSYCLKRIMQRMGLSETEAHRAITTTDQYRADYYKYYTHGGEWTNCTNYDLVLNSARVGQNGCVRLIKNYLKMKMEEWEG